MSNSVKILVTDLFLLMMAYSDIKKLSNFFSVSSNGVEKQVSFKYRITVKASNNLLD